MRRTFDPDEYESYWNRWRAHAQQWQQNGRKAPPPRLLMWEDVPPDQRLTRERVLRSQGARNREWVQAQRSRLEGNTCQVAVKWAEVLAPCGNPPVGGEPVCAFHLKNYRADQEAPRSEPNPRGHNQRRDDW